GNGSSTSTGSSGRAKSGDRQPRSARVNPTGDMFRSTSADDRDRPVSPGGTSPSYNLASALTSTGSGPARKPISHISANRHWRSEIAYCESRRDGSVKSGSDVRKGVAHPA